MALAKLVAGYEWLARVKISDHARHSREVLQRYLCAQISATLPPDLPNLWGVAVEFATRGKESRSSISANQAKVLVENLHELDAAAFSSDKQLFQDLVEFQTERCKPLGVILIRSNKKCLVCESSLMLRKDRPSPVVVYHDDMGTIPGSHYHKYCTNPSCGFVQYYRYYTPGHGVSGVVFNDDWESLTYSISSRETALSMRLLQRFDADIVIGQLSFKQCADVYNFLHNYTSDNG